MIHIKKFSAGDAEATQAFEIRRKVFVVEQQVPAREEFDEFESSSTHFLLIINNNAAGTCRYRFTEKGIKLERFAVLPEFRRNGWGAFLLKAALSDIGKTEQTLYLHAQVRAMNFYLREGFVAVGEKFSECDIDHYKMIYQPKNSLMHGPAESVRQFHESFLIGNAYEPCIPSLPQCELRHRLMHEENEEYLQACRDNNIAEVADALGDKLYILCGSILKHGLQYKIIEVFNEIHRSNMSKLDDDGKPIFREDGKVLKSNRYFKPDIEKVLEL